ncbi:MAG: hypothetical protein HXX18_05990 [Bacteroidetes bacterium]|nr:hypothetical protein [Bacteroidota bacterium]
MKVAHSFFIFLIIAFSSYTQCNRKIENETLNLVYKPELQIIIESSNVKGSFFVYDFQNNV